jgi:hypothetical protein
LGASTAPEKLEGVVGPEQLHQAIWHAEEADVNDEDVENIS